MAFTYTPDFTTDRDKIRLYIDDTVQGSGKKPNDANFTDEEIAGFVTAEGTWERAVAAAFEALAAAWIVHVTYQADNMAISHSHIARNYQEQAKQWRNRYGPIDVDSIHGAGSVIVVVSDEYADD